MIYKQEEKGTDDNFRFLFFKLDFNEFYKMEAQKKLNSRGAELEEISVNNWTNEFTHNNSKFKMEIENFNEEQNQ